MKALGYGILAYLFSLFLIVVFSSLVGMPEKEIKQHFSAINKISILIAVAVFLITF